MSRICDREPRPKNQVLGAKSSARHLDRVTVDDPAVGVQHVFEIELFLALVIHDGVRPDPSTPEEIDHVLDRRHHAVQVLEPELAGEGALQHQLGGAFGKDVVRHAGVVRA